MYPPPAPTDARPHRPHGAKQEVDGSNTKDRYRRAGVASTAEKGAWNTAAWMKTQIEKRVMARSPCIPYHPAYHYQRALRKGGVLVLVQCLTLEAANRQHQQCERQQ